MTLLVRDEADIIETHLRYHLEQGVDEFIVTDNLSTDETPEILEAFADRGVVRVIREPEDTYAQGRWVTRMARLAANEHAADWVVHADADEFFFCSGRPLADALESIPPKYGIVQIPRLNFRPRPGTGEPFHQRLVYREARPVNAHGQPLPPKVCHRAAAEATVTQGNHDVLGTRLKRLRAQPVVIFHYPLRSYPQFERKVRLGGAALLRNPDVHPNDGLRWTRLHGLLEAGGLPDFYARQELRDDDIDRAVRSGEVVFDPRLADRLAGRTDYGSEADAAGAGDAPSPLAWLQAKLSR